MRAAVAAIIAIGFGMGCAGKPAAAPEPVVERAEARQPAGELLEKVESALLDPDIVRVRARIRASGSRVADLEVEMLTARPRSVVMTIRGRMDGRAVSHRYVSTHVRASQGQAGVGTSSTERLLVGLVRDGFRADVERLLAGQGLDRPVPSLTDWLKGANPTRVVGDEAAIELEGATGRAQIWINESTLRPFRREQTVETDRGWVRWSERYEIELDPTWRWDAFRPTGICGMDQSCLLWLADTMPEAYDTAAVGLWYGLEAEVDRKRALELWWKGCMAGDLTSCRQRLAREDEATRGRLLRAATRLWTRRCGEGYRAWCVETGELENSKRAALRTDILLCMRGRADRCAAAAPGWRDLSVEIPPPSMADAAKLWPKQCERDAEACFALGLFAEDSAESAQWYGRGCLLGHEQSCHLVRFNPKRAGIEWGPLAEKLCRQGRPWACMDRASVPDTTESQRRHWLDLACEAGDGTGCAQLALIAGRSAASREERARVAELWGRACGGGHPAACDLYADQLGKLGRLRTRAQRRELHVFLCLEANRPEDCDRAIALGARRSSAIDDVLCRHGRSEVCWRIASSAADDDRRREALRQGCQLGDRVACLEVGDAFKACDGGAGVAAGCVALAAEVEGEERADWCRKACAAWRGRDRKDRRLRGHGNPGDGAVCRSIEPCE